MRTRHRLEQGDDIAEFAKGVHRQERRQGKYQLGFMVRIFIVAFRRIQWNARRVLFGKADFRGLLIRVNLNRERLVGTQYLKQERQLTKALRDRLAQQRRFILVNNLPQRLRLTRRVLYF